MIIILHLKITNILKKQMYRNKMYKIIKDGLKLWKAGKNPRWQWVKAWRWGGLTGWLNVVQYKAERNHSLNEFTQHDVVLCGTSAKGSEPPTPTPRGVMKLKNAHHHHHHEAEALETWQKNGGDRPSVAITDTVVQKDVSNNVLISKSLLQCTFHPFSSHSSSSLT